VERLGCYAQNPVCGTNQQIRAQTRGDLPQLSPYLIQAVPKVVHEGGNAAGAHDLPWDSQERQPGRMTCITQQGERLCQPGG